MTARLHRDERTTLHRLAYEDELVTPRLNPGTLTEKVATLRPRTVVAAREKRTITYSELTNGFTDLSRVDVGTVLESIGLLADRKGQPLLPAVVVRSKTGWPGRSFFDLVEKAEQVSEPVPPASNEDVRRWLWGTHLDAVWSYDWESPIEAHRRPADRDALFP